MPSLNSIQVIGNVGSEPEMRYTPSGKPVTDFSVAVNSKYGEKETTEWFKVVAWGKLAETCNQFVRKGMMVYADGRLQSSEWEGQDGHTRHRNEIVANKVIFLSRKDEPTSASDKVEGELEPEDIPF